jgi:PAS domain S-box-containing protein
MYNELMNLSDDSVLIKALGATGSPVTITDARLPDNPIVYCNDAFLSLTGYDKEEIIGKNCRFLQGSDTDRRKVTELKRSIDAAKDSSVTLLNFRKDGQSFWNDLRVSPVFDDKGELTHFIGFQNDITQRLEQERIELLTQKLENEINLMTVEKKRLAKLNEIKDDFISIASHQLRTPVTTVKQYLGMLESGIYGELSDKQRDAIRIAERNNERQLVIINELLKIATIDSGKVVLHKRTTDLKKIITSALDDFAPSLQAASIKAITQFDDTPMRITIDKDLMRTVVDNLLDNAIKYSPTGGSVTLSLTETAEDYQLAISDNGIGISEEDHEKIFYKFARSNSATAKNIGGTGLGLYWVKTIIELHGATIAVDSSPGKGSTFTITFPKKSLDSTL